MLKYSKPFSRSRSVRGALSIPLLAAMVFLLLLLEEKWSQSQLQASSLRIASSIEQNRHHRSIELASAANAWVTNGDRSTIEVRALHYQGLTLLRPTTSDTPDLLLVRHRPGFRFMPRWSVLTSLPKLETIDCIFSVADESGGPFQNQTNCDFQTAMVTSSSIASSNLRGEQLTFVLDDVKLNLAILGTVEIESLQIQSKGSPSPSDEINLFSVGDIVIGKIVHQQILKKVVRLRLFSARGTVEVRQPNSVSTCGAIPGLEINAVSDRGIIEARKQLGALSSGCNFSVTDDSWTKLKLVGYE